MQSYDYFLANELHFINNYCKELKNYLKMITQIL